MKKFMRWINNHLLCIRELLSEWWGSWIINLTRSQYLSIQFAECKDFHTRMKRFSGCPARVFSRVNYRGKYWTPFLVRVNPATLPVKRIRRLGRRWGRGCIWTY